MKRRVLITAGPTHEPVDRVRYLANRSSGRLGLALAAASHAAELDVTLLLGPISQQVDLPDGIRVIRFQTAQDLENLLAEEFPKADALIMAAAVADYRPKRSGDCKIERTDGPMTLELEPVPDLVAGCAGVKREDQLIIAFALEKPETLLTRAEAKLKRKKVDAIVANPLATMGSDEIAATLITAEGEATQPEGADRAKDAFAGWLVDWLIAKLMAPVTSR